MTKAATATVSQGRAQEPVAQQPSHGIGQVPAGATHFTLGVQLPNGRQAQVMIPIGATPLDVFVITNVLHHFLEEQPQPSPARQRLIIPQ